MLIILEIRALGKDIHRVVDLNVHVVTNCR